MKIAVFSDTHGQIHGAITAIKTHKPDLILHLGDHYRDAAAIHEEFPEIPMECVPGNCDYEPDKNLVQMIEPMGVKIMMTHGHTYRVKTETMPLLNAAFYQGANIVLFGHTHQAMYNVSHGLHIVNPGSAGKGKFRTWALIELEEGTINNIRLMDI